jgi:2-iminobutanoate/2-iminopropanoate deaminase
MGKEIIKTQDAPSPIGPYSQGVKVGNLIFVSGQGGVDPKTGKVAKGDIRNQTKKALENIRAILKTVGLTLDNVVKVTVFLRDLKFFSEMNEVYKEYFKDNLPARTTIQAIPPGDLDVEIEVIAYMPK